MPERPRRGVMRPSPRRRRRRRQVVVVIDDEPAILDALRRALRNEPFELRTTDDPRCAWWWIENEFISLIICNQRMPTILGTAILEAVRRRSPGTARILLTGYPQDASPLPGVVSDFALIAKPWNDAQLRRAIRKALAPRPGP